MFSLEVRISSLFGGRETERKLVCDEQEGEEGVYMFEGRERKMVILVTWVNFRLANGVSVWKSKGPEST